jgi:hypothetical protein
VQGHTQCQRNQLEIVGERFVVRDAHAKGGPVLIKPRWAMSLLRGPMTRAEIRRARAA